MFDSIYSAPLWWGGVRGANRKPRGRYQWYPQRQRIQNTLAGMLSLPGFAQLSDVAIIGGGYGWLSEELQAQGINCVNVETSDYILTTQATSEEQDLRDQLTADGFDPDNLPTLVRSRFGEDHSEVADPWAIWLRPDGQRTSLTLVDEDLSNNPSRRNVRNALPGNMDGILTENALDSMETEAEMLVLVERCEQLRPNPACAVVHLVSPGAFTDPRFPLGRSLQAWKDLLTANGFTDHRVASSSGEWV